MNKYNQLVKIIEYNDSQALDSWLNKNNILDLNNLPMNLFEFPKTLSDNSFKTRALLNLATWYGSLDIIKYLIEERKVDINNIANFVTNSCEGIASPLHIAVYNNNPTIIEYLIAHGSDIEAACSFSVNQPVAFAAKQVDQALPIHLAVREGYTEIVKLLLSKGATINNSYNILVEGTYVRNLTALHVASLKGHSEIVSLLIKEGSEIDIRDSYGDNPLHLAVFYRQKDTSKILIKEGSSIYSPNIYGLTPEKLSTSVSIRKSNLLKPKPPDTYLFKLFLFYLLCIFLLLIIN